MNPIAYAFIIPLGLTIAIFTLAALHTWVKPPKWWKWLNNN
jgi:hypothetical protein